MCDVMRGHESRGGGTQFRTLVLDMAALKVTEEIRSVLDTAAGDPRLHAVGLIRFYIPSCAVRTNEETVFLIPCT